MAYGIKKCVPSGMLFPVYASSCAPSAFPSPHFWQLDICSGCLISMKKMSAVKLEHSCSEENALCHISPKQIAVLCLASIHKPYIIGVVLLTSSFVLIRWMHAYHV